MELLRPTARCFSQEAQPVFSSKTQCGTKRLVRIDIFYSVHTVQSLRTLTWTTWDGGDCAPRPDSVTHLLCSGAALRGAPLVKFKKKKKKKKKTNAAKLKTDFRDLN